jgi:hypothetical protein
MHIKLFDLQIAKYKDAAIIRKTNKKSSIEKLNNKSI